MMKKFSTLKKILEAICIGTFLLAVLGCENADGTPNIVWIIPMLAICAICGLCLKKMEGAK